MMRSIILLTLLICSVCAMEMHRVEIAINELAENSGDVQLEQLPGVCWCCKWAMGHVKRHVTSRSSQSQIKGLLSTVCDGIGFLRSLCNMLISKYMDTLVEELSTKDSPRAICAGIGVC